jgi:Family of unknown function (DUF6188)
VDDFSASAELMNATLRGREVTRLAIGHEVKLGFSEPGSYAAITLGGPFHMRGASGSRNDIDPGHPETVAPVLSVLRSQLSEVAIADPGVLSASFADGRTLIIGPGDYEAWKFVGPGHGRVVCLPGGGLAHWLPSYDV